MAIPLNENLPNLILADCCGGRFSLNSGRIKPIIFLNLYKAPQKIRFTAIIVFLGDNNELFRFRFGDLSIFIILGLAYN